MNKYRVFIEGKNFLIEFDDKPKNTGFFTTRYVEAVDSAEAENKAIELIKNDSDLRSTILNEPNDPPKMYVEEIEELASFEGFEIPGTGYTFFEEEE